MASPLPSRTERALAVLTAALLTVAAPAVARPAVERYVAGDPAATTPDPVQPGLLLIGGGDHDPAAMRWFLQRAGHGHVVVLRASQSTDVAQEIYDTLHGAVSVETFVFHARAPANDPALLERLARADGIFIAGGDQSRYLKFWQHTGVSRAIDAHVRAGKPLAGTSAGLAILGQYVFSARTPATVTSPLALEHPTGRDITLDTDFLHVPVLRGYITDSHVDRRDRLGRLVAFVVRAQGMSSADDPPVEGFGVDEDTSVAVLPDGSAEVIAADPALGAVWVHGVTGTARAHQPLDTGALTVSKIGAGSRFNFRDRRVEQPLWERTVRIIDGEMHPR